MKLFVVVSVCLLALLPAVAGAAEPTLRVDPPALDCSQPRIVRATGMEPSTQVIVDMTWPGNAPGGVAGVSNAAGDFESPIPRVLLPCDVGGTVTAMVTKGGPAISTQFTVLPPGVTPVPPATGNTAASARSDGSVSFAEAGVALAVLTVGFALVGRRIAHRP